MLMRMFVANEVARLGGWLDWVAGSTGWLARLGGDYVICLQYIMLYK